jgi:hypothetical protein
MAAPAAASHVNHLTLSRVPQAPAAILTLSGAFVFVLVIVGGMVGR